MNIEFTKAQLETYMDNLSLAEKGCVDMATVTTLDLIIDMHFEEYDTISLAELLNMMALEAVTLHEES